MPSSITAARIADIIRFTDKMSSITFDYFAFLQAERKTAGTKEARQTLRLAGQNTLLLLNYF
jgi:hypothetical protein